MFEDADECAEVNDVEDFFLFGRMNLGRNRDAMDYIRRGQPGCMQQLTCTER